MNNCANAEQIIWATKLSANDSSAKERIGAVRVEDSVTYGRRKYVYVQNADATVTISQYDAVGYATASYAKAVTSDATDTTLNSPAGVALNTINPSYYGWILVAGYAEAINQNGGGDIAASDALILSSTDGRVDAVTGNTAPTNAVIGYADVADAGTYTVSGFVRCGDAV